MLEGREIGDKQANCFFHPNYFKKIVHRVICQTFCLFYCLCIGAFKILCLSFQFLFREKFCCCVIEEFFGHATCHVNSSYIITCIPYFHLNLCPDSPITQIDSNAGYCRRPYDLVWRERAFNQNYYMALIYSYRLLKANWFSTISLTISAALSSILVKSVNSFNSRRKPLSPASISVLARDSSNCNTFLPSPPQAVTGRGAAAY